MFLVGPCSRQNQIREGPEGNQQRIALAPTALDSNSYFNVVFGAMGRMEPGAAGATQAGRHTQTTGYMWSRNAAGAAGGVSAAALGRNVGIQVKGGPAAQVLRPALGPTNFLEEDDARRREQQRAATGARGTWGLRERSGRHSR